MFIVVFVTAKDKIEAEKISQKLIQEKLAACVNIVEGVRSLFWWEGKVDQANEILLVIKTQKTLFKKLEKAVKSAHSYTVPEIIALPIIAGNADYLKWIKDSTKGKK
jgi:periplasmic divalent cation tolerance protein